MYLSNSRDSFNFYLIVLVINMVFNKNVWLFKCRKNSCLLPWQK